MHRFIAVQLGLLFSLAVSAQPAVPHSSKPAAHSAPPAHGASVHHAAHWHATAEAVAAYRLLAQGGQVVFLRHAKTEMTAGEATPSDFADCSTQRNLSAAGRALANEAGEAVRRLRVPVGRVLASPYCRTVETARLMFGKVDPTTMLLSGRGAPSEGGAAGLRKLAGTQPRDGSNTFLIAHLFNVEPFGIPIEEGEAVILSPDGRGGLGVAGRISMTAWGDLVRDIVVQKLDASSRTTNHGAHGHASPSGHGGHGTSHGTGHGGAHKGH